MSSGYDDGYDDRPVPREDGLDDRYDRPAGVAYAKRRVKTPAVVMLAFAIISLVGVPLGAMNFFTLPKLLETQRQQIDQDPVMPAGQKQQMKDLLQLYEDIILMILPFTLTLQAVVGVLSVIGSLKMMNLTSRGWALTTAVLNMASLGHGCCFLTLPVGIWAMMVLSDDRVKAGFVAAARAARAPRDEY